MHVVLLILAVIGGLMVLRYLLPIVVCTLLYGVIQLCKGVAWGFRRYFVKG